MATGKQILSSISTNITPITKSPITKEFYNGERYIGSDGIEYPGYSPVATGTISDNPLDANYLSDAEFEAWAIDAFYDVDSYTNKALSILGVFKEIPNFSSIPPYVTDQLMRAVASKMEQNLYTKPANAEIKVTLTQSSGGRTTTEPARENFNPTDLLNQKVKAYIDGSGIDRILADSFQAIILNRNDYYTKSEIEALINAKQASIEGLYTADVENWTPTNPGDGVNYKYVKNADDELWATINSLIAGDVELKSSYIKLLFPFIESISGSAEHQSIANIEFTAGHKNLSKKVTEIGKRMGVPFSGYKTSPQSIPLNLTPTKIIGYDNVGEGTTDSFETFTPITGEYVISDDSLGDLVSFDITFSITGKPLQTVKAGKAYLYRNGELFIHPVTNNPVSTDYVLETILGTTVSLNAKDIPIRAKETGNGELEIGDVLDLRVSLSNASIATNIPHIVSKVHFDMVNMRTLNKDIFITESSDLVITNPLSESPAGDKINQSETNKNITLTIANNKADIEQKLLDTETSLQADIDKNTSDIANMGSNISQVYQIMYDMTYPLSDEPILIRKVNPSESLTNGVTATWIEIGEMLDGQTVIGGISSDGEVKSHRHNLSGDTDKGSFIFNPSISQTTDTGTYQEIGTGGTGALAYSFTSDHSAFAYRTAETGGTKNKAYGLGIGTGYKVWKRIA